VTFAWEPGDDSTSVAILAKHHSLDGALTDICKALGRRITGDAIRKRFKSRGLKSPTCYLQPTANRSAIDHGPPDARETEKLLDLHASKLTRLFFLPDSHLPYHDKAAYPLAIKAARRFKPDKFISLGDYADCYAVSFHPKTPERRANLKWELGQVNVGLDGIDQLDTEKFITLGNHEYRLARFIAERCPELYGLVDIIDSLKLKERGWHVTPYRESLQIGALRLTHDFDKAGRTAHEDAMQAVGGNAVIGHTHQMRMAYKGTVYGSLHVGAMFGWLGSVDEIDYRHRDKARREWAHGFGIGYMEADGTVHLQAVPIIGGNRCVIGGELIVADEYRIAC
jgi:hypothetical protein